MHAIQAGHIGELILCDALPLSQHPDAPTDFPLDVQQPIRLLMYAALKHPALKQQENTVKSQTRVVITFLIATCMLAQTRPVHQSADSSAAYADVIRRTKLSGVKKVYLSVSVSNELTPSITEDQIANDTELALRTRGIKALRLVDQDGSDGIFNVSIEATAGDREKAVWIRVWFEESATPKKVFAHCANTAPKANPDLNAITAVLDCLDFFGSPLTVWNKDALWLLGVNKLDSARQFTKDFVDAFVLDWLKANPTK
jgi:hypothetical protein